MSFFVLFYDESEGEKRRRRKTKNKKFAAVTFFFPFAFSSSPLSSSLTYPESVPDRGVDLDGLAIEHLEPLAGYIFNFRISERGRYGERFPTLFFIEGRKNASSPLSTSCSLSLSPSLHLKKLTLRAACSWACRRRASRSGLGGWCCKRQWWRREPLSRVFFLETAAEEVFWKKRW